MPDEYLTSTDVIRAAGGLVWRVSDAGRQLVIVHRRRHDDWSLPKGKLGPGESWREAALREVREETGCTAKLLDIAGCTAYIARAVPKLAVFWNMELIEQHGFTPGEEVERVEWMSAEEGLRMLTYPLERDLLSRAAGLRE